MKNSEIRLLQKKTLYEHSHWFDDECNLVSNRKKGCAAGFDELAAEHLKFSHPIVICILSKLLSLFVLYPASF
jgi:hypothetical protein